MSKKKILSLCLVIALAAVAVLGGTLAYFTDTAENTNTFTMGNVAITLDEAPVERVEDEWVPVEGEDRVEANEYANIYPGVVLPKDPTVHNIGSYGAYVRVKITADLEALTGMQAAEDLTKILDIDTVNWTFVKKVVDEEAGTVTFIYNYNTELAAEADTTAVFTEVSIPAALTNEDIEEYGLDNFEIKIVAEAIQADSFADVTEAFAAYDA